jgi:hypothetical protein
MIDVLEASARVSNLDTPTKGKAPLGEGSTERAADRSRGTAHLALSETKQPGQ